MSDLGPWNPMTPLQVAALFRAAGDPGPWWFAGGYAIEMFVGRPVRAHADIDVLLLRRDQHLVHRLLPGWDIQAADPPGHLRPWAASPLPAHVHDIWCRETPSTPWRLQFMLDEAEGDRWHSRRDRRISRPIGDLGRLTREGLPYLRPEVQLFYKATASVRRPKDEVDFTTALPLLDAPARRWLTDAVTLLDATHPWLPSLQTP